MPRTESTVDVEGRHLKLSNLGKVLYPDAGFTKAQVIDYYVRIAPVLLPHLRGRPLTMKRYPEGVSGQFFYEKNCPAHRPDWVQTADVWSPGNNKWMKYCMVQDLPTLIWAANLADIELHTSLSLAADVLRPTMIVFDLDPGAPSNIVQCCQVALWVRRLFEHFGMKSFAKTSGSKGLQVYIPLNTAVDYDHTKPFAHEMARMLERAHPELIVSDMKKALRVGKVLVDWSQNDDYKTTICVYSLRAKERPTVSTPVTWDEVEQCFGKGDPSLLVFESYQVLERVGKLGDLYGPVLELKQKLPAIEALNEAAPVVGGTPLASLTAKAKRTTAAQERKTVHAAKQTRSRPRSKHAA
ncbi:MAG TPA: non-homologous end-joining DNA ligase [Terriglobales bacterium]|jgi:bifunctional non-homologous end joining protein LigD|nr:non-homologous end-joining DNA ligase [Terriglobales bacterium]